MELGKLGVFNTVFYTHYLCLLPTFYQIFYSLKEFEYIKGVIKARITKVDISNILSVWYIKNEFDRVSTMVSTNENTRKKISIK